LIPTSADTSVKRLGGERTKQQTIFCMYAQLETYVIWSATIVDHFGSVLRIRGLSHMEIKPTKFLGVSDGRKP